MTERDRLNVEHILDSIQRIEQYVAPGRTAFFSNTIIQDAVVRNLQVIGESAKRLSEALRAEASTISWGSVSGLRNVLVHDYLGVDLERIWDIVSADLGLLQTALRTVLDSSSGSGPAS